MKEWSYWISLCIYVVSGYVIGILFHELYPLIAYIHAMDQDEDNPCDRCEHCKTCFALKEIGSSNMVTELTYTSYMLVKQRCMHISNPYDTNVWLFRVLNGVLYAGVFVRYGCCIESVLYCTCSTVLICVAVVDWKTQYIPLEFNLIILIVGLIGLITEPDMWLERLIGFASISSILLFIDVLGMLFTKGSHVIGGGDIKLMAAAGLLLGWKLNIVAFMMGCVLGTIIHLIIMKIGKGEHRLAFGPYLSMGIYISIICGEQLMSWYLSIMGL